MQIGTAAKVVGSAFDYRQLTLSKSGSTFLVSLDYFFIGRFVFGL